MPVMRLCFAGCPSLGIPIYHFPSENEPDRRNLWFQMFGIDPALYANKTVHICRRHFSNRMAGSRALPKFAYPDVNLYMHNVNVPYTERYSVYWKNDERPPGEDQVMAIDVSEGGDDKKSSSSDMNQTVVNSISRVEIANTSYEGPVTELSDDVVEVVVPQEAGQRTSRESLSLLKHQKRQCILNCTDSRNFHNFPSLELEPERRKQWLYLLAKDPDAYPHKYLYLCDRHFDLHMRGKAKLMRGAYPNKNLPPPLQTPIPEDLEAKTECIQKCTDYKRKYRFPSLEQETARRLMWFEKFGRDPRVYSVDIYACDRHFSDEMRIGPYLRREAVPNANLRPAAAFAKVKKWSLQKLDALSKNQTNTTSAPSQIAKLNTHQLASSVDKMTNAPPTVNQPPENGSNLNHILVNTTIRLPVNQSNQQTLPSLEKTAATQPPSAQQSKNDDILSRINMTILPPTEQPKDGSPPEQYVKMHTVGVFVPRRTGYVVAVDKILSAEDPLDVNKHMPYDYVGPYDIELNMDVHKICKEDFGVFSSDEESDNEEQDEVEDTEGPECEVSEDSENGDYEAIPVKRKRTYRNFEDEEQNEVWPTNEDSYNALQAEMTPSETESETETGVSVHLAPVLEQLAATYPPESFSIYINKCNKMVECRKEAGDGETINVDDVITPDEPIVISDEEEPATISRKVVNSSSASTIGETRLPSQTSYPQHSKTEFAENFLNQREQKKANSNLLTKEVGLAKSWQQVIETIDKGLISNAPQVNASVANITKPKQIEGNANAAKIVPIEKVKTPAVASSTHNARNIVGGGVLKKINITRPGATALSTAAKVSNTINIVDPLEARVTHNSCVLNCESFRKLFTFPSAATEKHRRHFWFLELGLNLKTDWHKSLHICDKHFADNMLIEDKLHTYAYPSKAIKCQLNKAASTQTEDLATEKDYPALLRELAAYAELDKQQERVITRTKFLIRLKQEAARLVTEIRNAEENADASQNET